jgi:antitoxin CcdA
MGKEELKLEIDADLLAQARAAEVQLSLVMERALKIALGPEAAQERADKWAAESADAIASHNRFVRDHGAFGEDLRGW